jgi:Zn-dependent peptidase ImmA (M78 family)/transcriptional regulator with XRE-family HTH domain
MMAARVPVNPDVLRWARETAGLSVEDAAKQIQLNKAKGMEPAERLARLEEGKDAPTRPLLVRMSKRYRRPLLAFYMPQPPQTGQRGQDFRRLPASYGGEEEPLVDALLRDVQSRQRIVRAVLADEEQPAPLDFVGSLTPADAAAGAEQAANTISARLGFDSHEFREQASYLDAFAYLRGRCERLGVFVLLIGDLGSHHTAFSTSVFRGFALSDELAPFIVINDHDAKAAWSFTLLHELTHIWLGQTGISGDAGDSAVEQFCNEVAGRILLPLAELADLHVSNNVPVDVAAERISTFARERFLSRPMVAYSLFRAGRINHASWSALSERFHQQWLAQRERERELAKLSEGGPNYFVVRRHRVGPALLDFVRGALASGVLSTTKAAKVLGVKAHNVYRLLGA